VFIEQHFMGRVILWMVVGMTISGVLLAAVQLMAAYRLAESGRGTLGDDGSISMESGKISVKSSVTGLLILVVSFAFFLVFVERVYTIRRISDTGRETTSADNGTRLEAVPMSAEMPAPAKDPGASPNAAASTNEGDTKRK
jgi:hypothetical protein